MIVHSLHSLIICMLLSYARCYHMHAAIICMLLCVWHMSLPRLSSHTSHHHAEAWQHVEVRSSMWSSDRSCVKARVGQNHIYTYTVYIRYFWQGYHQIYGHIRCTYTALAYPSKSLSWAMSASNKARLSTVAWSSQSPLKHSLKPTPPPCKRVRIWTKYGMLLAGLRPDQESLTE
jgi:hypothetical protein